MSIFKTTAAAALVAGAGMFGSADTAEAGGITLSFGRPSYNSYYGGGFNRGYYNRGFNRSYYGGGFNRGYYGGGSLYHDTSHVDVINGRRVFHRSGHWDHYGRGHFGGHGGFGGHHGHH